MLFEENQLEIIDCGLFVPYSCTCRMNFYEIMFLVFKGRMYHIHQRVNLQNFLLMMRLLQKAKVLVQRGRGGGVLLKITVGGVQHAS